jgi:hypothetical protein
MTGDDLELVPGRGCGDCTVCCTVMAVDKPEMQKEAGAPCRHCAAGCAVDDTRPALCRDFYCGWRHLPILDESWRPDKSGVFVEFEAVEDSVGLSLVLIGNPLKTLRQAWFIEFVAVGVRQDVALLLGIPGPQGHQGASLLLNTRQMRDAAHTSPVAVKLLLEAELKRLRAHDFPLRTFTHSGNDFGVG